jgi:CBS domain containing-hemolysin-like protein
MRPIARVKASMPMDDVLAAMRSTGTHLAAVIGEDEQLAGLVTMEDVLRELVGRAAVG